MTDLTTPGPVKGTLKHSLWEFWQYFSENKGALVGLYFIAFLVLVALFADVIAPHDPISQNRGAFLKPPAWHEGGSWEYILGTDAVGRGVLSRIIHGTRYSLLIAIVVVFLSMVIGITVGLIAGYAGGWTETMIMRLMDIILAFPSLLLALVMVAILGPGLLNTMIAIAIVLLPHFVRLTRSSVIAEKRKEYSMPRRSGFSAWVCSHRPRNGARCWPMPASSSSQRRGWSPIPALRSC